MNPVYQKNNKSFKSKNDSEKGYTAEFIAHGVFAGVNIPPKLLKKLPKNFCIRNFAINGIQHYLEKVVSDHVIFVRHDGKIRGNCGCCWPNAKENLERELGAEFPTDEIGQIKYFMLGGDK